MYLTKDQLKNIVSKKPASITEQQVVEELIKQGHTFEGIENVPVSARATLEPKAEIQPTQNPLAKVGEFIGEASGLTGTLKAVGGAASGSEVASRSIGFSNQANQLIDEAKKLPTGDPRKKQLLLQAQKISSGAAKGAEQFIERSPTVAQAAGSMGKLGLTVATLGTPGVASGIKGAVGVGARVVEGGILGALFQVTDNLENKRDVGTNVKLAAGIGATIPLAGAAISKGKQLLQKSGEKIQYSVIKPSAADIRDGFDIKNVKKYNLGGSLGETAHKTQDKLDDLTKQLQERVNRTDVAVDLNDVYEKTIKDLIGNKSKNFGNINSTKRVLTNLQGEIEEVSTNGLVDLAESQAIKQAAGLKGSWVYGSADPDASAVEKVYTAFYRQLKEEIEKKAPAGVQEINKQISELIPIMNATIRRIPVAERNAVLSLTDVINLGVTAVHPSGAALLAINKLSKSGRVGNLLSKLEAIKPATNIGKRIFGR